MLFNESLSAWTDELSEVFDSLSKPQVKVLAMYSLGMAMAARCGLSCVAFLLAQALGRPFETMRERLRDFYCSAGDKTGDKRRDLSVQQCFAPLLAWVLKEWNGSQLALALDATTLSTRFTVLCVSVLFRSTAIPVAWMILPAMAKGRWKPHWISLLQSLRQNLDTVAPSRKVLVLADRGLYARWLFRTVVKQGWHPMLRINSQNADFQPEGGDYRPVASLLKETGDHYCAQGVMFRSPQARLTCTLTACWAEGCDTPWLVVTDLAPDQVQAAWYGMRNWIERSFKLTKSGGWNWQDTRMTDPRRAERQWLAMAVATVFLLRQGGSHECDQPQAAPMVEPHSGISVKPSPVQSQHPRRILSAFRTGLILVQLAVLGGLPRAHKGFSPEPWTQSPQLAADAAPVPNSRSP
jgi:hypothetical protein